jgi:CRP-like cAMP-binding protein
MDQPISLDAVIEFLVSTPFFDGLDPFERAEVVRIMEVLRLQEGEEIFREGTSGDSWYVIFEGEVRVLKDADTQAQTEIARLGPGRCFGEMAILDGMPRSASVRAAGPLTIFRFRRDRFDGLLAQGSLGAYKLIAAMARVLSHRHRQLTQQIFDLLGADARVPAAHAGASVDPYQVSE